VSAHSRFASFTRIKKGSQRINKAREMNEAAAFTETSATIGWPGDGEGETGGVSSEIGELLQQEGEVDIKIGQSKGKILALTMFQREHRSRSIPGGKGRLRDWDLLGIEVRHGTFTEHAREVR